MFKRLKQAKKYFEKQKKSNRYFIHYGETVPITVNDYLNALDDDDRKRFVMYNKPIFTQNNIDVNIDVNIYIKEIEEGKLYFNKRIISSSLENRKKIIEALINKYGSIEKNNYVLPKYIIDCRFLKYVLNSAGFNIKILMIRIIISGFIEELNTKFSKFVKNSNEHLKINKIENVGRGNFYGFSLDGNQRYIMDNGIITYNSNGKSTTQDLLKYTLVIILVF